MLIVDDTNAKQTFASSASINLVPNVYAEWNYNTFYSPATVASSVSSEIISSLNPSLNLSLNASWSSLNSTIITQASGRTTDVRTTAICPQFKIVGFGDTITSVPITVSSTAKNNYYKMVFYMKSKTIQTFGTPSGRVKNGTLVASINPSTAPGSSTWYYRIVPVGADGESYGLDYIGFSDQLTASNVSSSQVLLDVSTSINVAGYDIYRSSIINDNNPTYLTTIASTGQIVQYVDNITSNKSKNLYPSSNFTNKIYVSPEVDCYNNTTLVNSSYIVKVFDDSNSNNYLPTGTAIIDPIGWKKIEVWFGTKPNSTNTFNKINLNLNCYAEYQGYEFYADNFQIYEVTEYDFLFNTYYSLESAFNPARPGESLLNPLMKSTNSSRYVNYGLWNQATRPCSFYTQNPELITDNQYPYKQYLPSIYDNFQYYISQPGLTSTGIQAYYDTYLKTNKIVLKIDKFFCTSQTNSLTIVTDTGSSTVNNVVFGDDGIAVIYYNGVSWTQTAWSNPPQLNQNGQIQTFAGTNLFVKLRGIRFSITNIVPSTNINVDGQSSSSAVAFGIIEISPRLEIDISPLLMNLAINKEISQTGDDSFPIGYMSSNNLSVSVSNIPVYYNGLPFTIFENDATESTFYNLMRQGVKFTTFYSSPMKSFTGNIPAGIFYSDMWQINDIDTVEISCFDQSKYLMMSTPAPQYSATNAGLLEIITDILNVSGFSDYNYDSLVSVLDQKAKINYFWCDETTTVFETLQSLFIAHQISAFFDEYGIMQFLSLKSILNKFNSSSYSADFFVGDRAETVGGISYSPNIIPGSFNENIGPKVGKIIINYKMPTTLISDYVSDLNSDIGLISKKRESVKTIWQEDVGIGLSCTPISQSMNTYQNYFNTDPGLITATSSSLGQNRGDAFIGSEIVSFEGVEYTFFPSNNYSLSINKIITGSSDIDAAVKELKDYVTSLGKSFDEIRYYPTGKIVGVMRGKYNTPIQEHNIYDSLASTQYATAGTVSPTNYFKSCNINVGATTATFGTLGAGTTFTYGDLKMSNSSFNNSTLITPNELSKNYNYYAAEFRSTYRHAEQTKAGLFFNISSSGGSTSSALFLAFSRYPKTTNTQIELFSGSPGGTAQKYIYDDSQSRTIKTYKQVISVDLFDGNNHRLAVYLSNPFLYIYVNGREISKIQLSNNLNALVPNSTSNFGAFVQNISDSGIGVANVTCNEIYACNFPVYDSLNNKPDFKYLPRYHFNSETFLDNIVHGIPNTVDHYLWQAKPLIRGMKFYDVKHSLSPAIPSTATLEKVFYGVAVAKDNETRLILKRVDAWDASYSNLCLTPFRSRFVVSNNHNEILWLKVPGDNIGNLTIFPLQIQSNYQYLTESKVLQKVIDKRYANNSVQLTTDWIQSEGDAYRILMDSASLLTGFHREITINIFGNPLIQLGDFCKFTYTLKRMGTQVPLYYFVKSIAQSNDNGLETQLVLKPMIFA